ncbi:DMT family transporter [Aliiglaciecola sp. M165]|uniref:DMT family transporter n=1 Tax=Aliiglaciecola sp. M165 TaxID=2593649 RepID=UPI00117C89A5|nr:DMT family transporter [Aliiglaciecola sp. M165]TRY32530.1 DMT family transporter [Aliiglaciecola sp. M165]
MNWNGFLLSLTTAVLWGVLPVFLHICLQALDSQSITWLRFLVAAGIVLIFLANKRALPNLARQSPKILLIALIAALLLVVNYVTTVQSLAYVSPETVQVVMQVAPIMLMLGGIFFYKERLNPLAIFGAVTLFSGLGLFFSPNIGELLLAGSQYNKGIVLVLIAATAWAGYALSQKLLLRSFTAKQLTLIIYVVGIIALLPFIDLSGLANMTGLQWGALVFCCINTVVAYGCFTEALAVWNSSKVGAVVATGPVFTFICVAGAEHFLPGQYAMIELNVFVLIGALCVVSGSMMTALSKDKTL